MNMDTNYSYYKKNGNLLYDIPVFISQPQILSDASILSNIDIFNKYNMINIDDKFIRDLSMYGYKLDNKTKEFFVNSNNISNNNFQILIMIASFILFIYILFSCFC